MDRWIPQVVSYHSAGDDWDDLSVKSGASSDDEDFVVLKLANDVELPAFERHRCNSIDTDTDTPSDVRDIETASSVSSTTDKTNNQVNI